MFSGSWSVVIPSVRLLSALPQTLTGVCCDPPNNPEPPQLQGQHHTKEREIHTHGVQGEIIQTLICKILIF